ncbi:hypothetical protein BKA91DRAFT_128202 [Yarrowia lipolytica]|uniref:F-box domain-containing protein n=1 Tax=Yarrowia lipolytica TaxID=4952 RepID=A0A371C640_YARLL|nr:hypothetical protein BKA91DRAFT_128202 [Yarrowia lipolytica]KAE8174043.1 hypothetical protein BKA90DRAFT_127246 [Yarrowia lipolytica]RDW25763.1 hypothetical protein B0I71DRAFT_140739 [Yarrowia lipolytica]RMI95169.1 hypothetical protein BD777DRAFT_137725 [Yarrowia lipolytica]
MYDKKKPLTKWSFYEIVLLIAEELDLESIIALSQTSASWRRLVSDTLFQRAIRRSCPWFEPQFSDRGTWKACAIEQVRRSKPGVDITPKLKTVSSTKFHESPVLDTSFERLDKRKIANLVYTSEYGIRVDLSNTCSQDLIKDRDLHGNEYGYEPEDRYDSKVISFPHMLVIMAVCEPDERPEGDIIIKFKGSKGLQPDMFEKCFEMPNILTFGDHVFLVMPSLFSGWALFYLVDREFEIVAEVDGYNESVSYYDGLIHYFRGGIHHVLQPQLGREAVSDSAGSGSIFDLLFLGKRNDHWDYHYAVVPTHLGTYIVDVSRGLMTRLTTDISTTPEVGPTDSTTQDENIVVDFLPCVPLYQNQQLRPPPSSAKSHRGV